MNILYFTYTMPKPSSPRRGVFILRRIEELKNQGINLYVVTTEHIFNILKYEKYYNFLDFGYNVNQEVRTLLKIENPYNYFNLLFKSNINSLIRIIKEKKIDLIHSHFIRDSIYAYEVNKSIGIPYVHTSHGFDIRNMKKNNKTLLSNSIITLENASKSIFVSKSLLNTAIKYGYKNNNSINIANGYSRKIFYHSNDNEVKNSLIIGFCATLNKNKRADKLPAIFAKIKNKIPNTKLLIIGDGPLKSTIYNEFNNLNLLDSVEFTGSIPQEEIAKYMNKMDVFILPSINEGFPTVIPEALACGLQAVTSDADGTPEAVANAGYVISQSEPDFEERFAQKVIYALENPIDKSIILMRAEELTWENIIKQEIRVYEEVLNKR